MQTASLVFKPCGEAPHGKAKQVRQELASLPGCPGLWLCPPRCSVASVFSWQMGKQKQGLLRAGMVKRLSHHWLEHSHMAAPSSKGSWERCSPFPAGRGDGFGEHLASLPGPFPAQRVYNLGIFHFTAPTLLIPLCFYFCPYKCLLLTEVYSFPMCLISCWPLLTGTELWCSVHHCLLRILDRAWPAEGT